MNPDIREQVHGLSPLGLRNLRSSLHVLLHTIPEGMELHTSLMNVLYMVDEAEGLPEQGQERFRPDINDEQVKLHARTMADHLQTRKQLGNL